nr:unnamed protein product [Callosobruchus analis]
MSNGRIIKNPNEVANAFAEFYTNVGTELSSKIEKCEKYTFGNKQQISKSIFLKPTCENHVIEKIINLKNNKSPGHDGIKAEHIKEIVMEIAKPLTCLFNNCIEQGIFPETFKSSIVKPIFKTGSKTNLSNYRPISLITNFAKIFEKILHDQVTNFLERNELFSPKQYGFRQARSTQDAIVDLTTHIYKALDVKRPAMAIFVDLAKAFDTVNHDKLLEMMEYHGFRGLSYKLFKSYLTGRLQRVKIGDTFSKSKIIKCGVPQGTVLGPTLFNLYMSDLFQLHTQGHIVTFADDTAILYEEKDWRELRNKVEADLDLIFHYFQNKCLTVNSQKTFFVPFASLSSYLPKFENIMIKRNCDCQKTTISVAYNLKYLGIMLDSHMRWDIHINYVIKKVRSFFYKFRYLKQIFTIRHFKTLYYALIEPHLLYGIVAWGGTTNNHMMQLERAQRWILKIMLCKDSTYPTEALYEECEVFDIRQLFCHSVLMRQHCNRSELISIDHYYATRNPLKYKTPRVGKTVTQRSYFFLGPRLYNLLPDEIKQLNSKSMYRSSSKKWIKSKSRKEIHRLLGINTVFTMSAA